MCLIKVHLSCLLIVLALLQGKLHIYCGPSPKGRGLTLARCSFEVDIVWYSRDDAGGEASSPHLAAAELIMDSAYGKRRCRQWSIGPSFRELSWRL